MRVGYCKRSILPLLSAWGRLGKCVPRADGRERPAPRNGDRRECALDTETIHTGVHRSHRRFPRSLSQYPVTSRLLALRTPRSCVRRSGRGLSDALPCAPGIAPAHPTEDRLGLAGRGLPTGRQPRLNGNPPHHLMLWDGPREWLAGCHLSSVKVSGAPELHPRANQLHRPCFRSREPQPTGSNSSLMKHPRSSSCPS